MDVKTTLTYRMARFATFHKVELERRLQSLGLHYGQVFVLFELWDEDCLTQAELASRLGLSAPTVLRMVRSLETGGFLEVVPAANDARLRKVQLTTHGLAIRSEVIDCWRSMEESLAGRLTTTELLVLTDLAGKLSAGGTSEKEM